MWPDSVLMARTPIFVWLNNAEELGLGNTSQPRHSDHYLF